MESDFDPPVCNIDGLRIDEVDELYATLEPNLKSNGGLLRDRSIDEIIHDIHQYFVVRIENIIVGTFQLRESLSQERFLELGALVVCAKKHHREQVKRDIIEFSRKQSRDKCLELISLTSHPGLQKFYDSVGGRLQQAGIYPLRESDSPGVPLFLLHHSP